jgi:hypothetical protein
MVARLATSLAATLAVALPPAVASAATVAADAPAGARLAACHRSPSIDQRVAVVGAWMRPLPGGRRLVLKVDLWERTPGQRWTIRSDVPGLGGWTTPSDAQLGTQPGDVFKYRQAVGRLEVPAAYRFRVAFRWLSTDGAVVREATRTTAVCREPDVRPDLVPLDVRTQPAGDGLVRYVVRVGNEGSSAVQRATVAATFPGETTPGLHVRVVRRLAPGAAAVVRFTGPGCADGLQPASFVVDPSNAVEETDETNNTLAAVCPAS